MANDQAGTAPCTAPELLLKIVLAGTLSHYETRGMIDDLRLEHLLDAGKQILYKSHQESDVRQNLGFSPSIWEGLTGVLTRAIPALEVQSFAWKNPPSPTQSGDLIALNYFTLVKDIERLNDLCTIARNLLATTKKAQNLAADKGFDQQILKLIDVCVKVSARGFEGETNARNEEKWHKVVDLYKRLLITCLQFLHNFIMHHEQRKLVLWLDLFGSSQQTDAEPARKLATEPHEDTEERIQAAVRGLPAAYTGPESNLGYNIEDVHALFDLMSTDKTPDGATQDTARKLMDQIRSDMERLSGLSASQLDENPEALLKVGAALRAQLPIRDALASASSSAESPGRQPATVSETNGPTAQSRGMKWTDLPNISKPNDTKGTDVTDEDRKMPRSCVLAASTLRDAKRELMTRLKEATAPMVGGHDNQAYDPNGDEDLAADDSQLSMNGNAESAMDEEDEEDEDEDYRQPGDQERGLLTDVPLVLGPTEIEALPMIIQSGIVDSFSTKANGPHGARNMQAVRCHILLAQQAGRNVLRELLIFIAAWDLPDDVFYFKMMVQIMEAILQNGLMTHAYADFGQAKDIISPAQAVVIKILTHIFRSKYSPAAVVDAAGKSRAQKQPAPITRVDILTVRYIFTVFRSNIVPETCALIYLQGQIRARIAPAQEFPLNLWDMERVYEGVYQFLEFFAVLTESNDWKTLLVEWEIVYDLVTLLRELDSSIEKGGFRPGPSGAKRSTPAPVPAAPSRASNTSSTAVERPYDPTLPEPTSSIPATPGASGSYDDLTAPSTTTTHSPLGTEEPAEFEWRNLKKLIVLVLSSLVWKCDTVKNQIRAHGGVEVILTCTQYDAHNPYIKEHAVMCLKFLLEGNKENQAIVEELEAREIVRDGGGVGDEDEDEDDGDGDGEVKGIGKSHADFLHNSGLEAKLCDDGKVRLVEAKRRDPEPRRDLEVGSGEASRPSSSSAREKEKGVAGDGSMEELMEMLEEPLSGAGRASQ